MKFSSRGGEQGSTQQVVLLVLGGLAVLILLAVVAGLWLIKQNVRVQSERTGDAERVEIETPLGGMTVLKADDAAQRLKLPVYPGSAPRKQAASVRLWGRIGDEEGALNITVAQFQSMDGLEGVDNWYREQLGPRFEREVNWTSKREAKEIWREHIHVEPGDVAYVYETESQTRGVVLHPKGPQVRITLFEVAQASHQ